MSATKAAQHELELQKHQRSEKRRKALLLFALLAAGCADPETDTKVPDEPEGPLIELSDEASLALLADWRGLPVFGDGHYSQSTSQDRLADEEPIFTLFQNGNRDMNNFVCASADASYPPLQVVPFVFDEPSCAEPYVQGVVLSRKVGSGRLSRLWMTQASIRNGLPPDEEVLRIWIDDVETPAVEAKLSEIIDGTAGEMFAPPFGAGPGDHITWYYPVVFSKKLIIALDQLGQNDLYYHQTAIVLDPEPLERKPAKERLPLRDDAKELLNARETGPAPGKDALLPEKTLALPPGIQVVAADLQGPATILEMRARAPESAIAALADVDLRITWDNAAEGAISLPLGELLASALAPAEGATLALAGKKEGTDVVLSLRLPMPFAERAQMQMTNMGAAETQVSLAIFGEAQVPNAPHGYLHTFRSETLSPNDSPTHPIASFAGQGRWVGTCLMAQGKGLGDQSLLDDPLNFLEGDELVTLDGVLASQGTGTEDYFNGAFYFESGPRSYPFAAWWGVGIDGEVGHASACRFHVLTDAVDAAESADIALEIGSANPAMAQRYRTVAFVYLPDP